MTPKMGPAPAAVAVGSATGFLLAVAILAFPQAAWKGTIAKEGGVVVVKNPRQPIHEGPVFQISEDFVLGGKAAEGKYVLGMPGDIAVDTAGNIYVADLKERNIKVFDGDGKYLKTIGRPGQGPGEFQFPRYIATLTSKNDLAVFDLRAVSVFSADGTFLRQFPLRGITSHNMANSQGEWLIAAEDPRANQTAIKRFAPDMSRELSVITEFGQVLEGNPFAPRAWWTTDASDHLVFGSAKDYEILFIDMQGHVVRRITRDYDPVKVTQAEKDDLMERTRLVLGPDEARSMKFSPFHSAFRSFFMDDGGRLFVQTWERTRDGKSDVYDIFDPDGRYLARAPMPVHPDFQAPTARVMRKGKLCAIEPDAEGYEVVKRYSVHWIAK